MGRVPGAEVDTEFESFRLIASALRQVNRERAFIRSQGDAAALAQEGKQIVQVPLIVDLDPHSESSLLV